MIISDDKKYYHLKSLLNLERILVEGVQIYGVVAYTGEKWIGVRAVYNYDYERRIETFEKFIPVVYYSHKRLAKEYNYQIVFRIVDNNVESRNEKIASISRAYTNEIQALIKSNVVSKQSGQLLLDRMPQSGIELPWCPEEYDTRYNKGRLEAEKKFQSLEYQKQVSKSSNVVY